MKGKLNQLKNKEHVTMKDLQHAITNFKHKNQMLIIENYIAAKCIGLHS